MTLLLGLLAILSASAAAGMRLALPLLIVGLVRGQLWGQVPLLSQLSPQVAIAVLTSWSLVELFASKRLLGQRALQGIQLLFTPVVGAMMAVTVAKLIGFDALPIALVAGLGSVFALVLRLVAVGWFFRLRGIPPWLTLVEDLLCVGLVLFALEAPKQGGIIAMLLLWLAVRSSNAWRRYFVEGRNHSSSRPD